VDLSDSDSFEVAPLPRGPAALVVDTFAALEYSASCSWPCPYLVYAPVMKVREATGARTAVVEAVEYSIPTMTTGWVPLTLEFCPGSSSHLNGIDPYLYNNDYVFVSRTRIEGMARARVLVRDEAGRRGLIDVSAPIRMSAGPHELPPPLDYPAGRVC
jgi:hypothetical protein